MKINFSQIEERATVLLKENNFYKPNFNINRLAEKLGISIEEKVLGSDISGFLVIAPTKSIITINDNNGDTRKRFTIAHEIGHYILHRKTQPLFVDRVPKVLYRDANSSTGEDFREREANAFAASLLIPQALLEEQIKKAPNDIADAIEYLAKKFGVSPNAMTFRLSNLGYGI